MNMQTLTYLEEGLTLHLVFRREAAASLIPSRRRGFDEVTAGMASVRGRRWRRVSARPAFTHPDARLCTSRIAGNTLRAGAENENESVRERCEKGGGCGTSQLPHL